MEKVKRYDSYSYLVDNDFKIVYASDELKYNIPSLKLGDICYKVLGNSDSPCKICPILNKVSSVKYSYNNKINRWTNISSAKINYPNLGECNMIICDLIDDTINDRVVNLSDYNSYDKIYEVDIINDKYRTIVDKYGLAINRNGNYKDLIEIIKEKVIHESEINKFEEIMFKKLFNKHMSSSINFAFKERFKTKDSINSWLQFQLVSVDKDKNGNLKKFIVFCKYLKDIYYDVFHLNTDKLTGLPRTNDYLSLVEQLLNNNPDIDYSMVSIDIEHFKMFNEWYGMKEGDNFLIEIASKLKEIDNSINSISGYFGNDNFCIVLPNKETNYRLLEYKLSDYIKKHGNGVSFLPHFGVYEIKDRSISLSQMYDRAVLATDNSKGNFSNRFSYYNDSMLGELKNEQLILQNVKQGIMNNEFTFYLQPLYNIENNKIVSCEALVRWISKNDGVIPAYKFIPVLEKTGFIVEIDKLIWEQVFKWQRSLIDKGIKPIPISVNVSRIDLYYLDIASFFCNLIDKYKIDPSLIEIEITESAYIQSFEKIKDKLNKLQSVGFQILMDDFGSGYSSLNMLKNVDVDVLKLDMKFLQLNNDSQKGVNILESIVNMIKIINIPVICEGVETEEQKNLLMDIGCRYAQGYLFNRPIPKEEVETKLLNTNNVDYDGITNKNISEENMLELTDGSLLSNVTLNSILGAVAFVNVSKGKITIERVNEQFYKLFGFQSFTDINFKSNILKYIHQNDHEEIFKAFDEAYENQLVNKSSEFRYLFGNKVIWMSIKIKYLNQNANQRQYCVSFDNIDDKKEKENQSLLLNKILKSTLRLGRINCFEWNIKKNQVKIFTPFHKIPLYGEAFEHYDSYVLVKNFPETILTQKIIGKYLNLVKKYINNVYTVTDDSEIEFEMPFTYQGGYLWYQIKGKCIFNEYNELIAFIGTYVDITKIVYNRFKERDNILKLNFFNQTALYSMDINLSKNSIYNIYGEFDNRNIALQNVKEYDSLIKALALFWVHDTEREKFISLFSREGLVNAYNSRKSYVSFDFRVLDNGNASHLKISVYLRKVEKDIIAYMFCNDVSMLYNIDDKVDHYLLNENYGVINLDIDSYDVINANNLAAQMHNFSNTEDFISRIHKGIPTSVYIYDKPLISDKLSLLTNLGDHQTFEYRILLENNDFKYISCNAIVQKNIDNEYIQLLLTDVTNQKKLELTLLYEDSLKELKALNASNENKAFFLGVNKIFDAIYFCNVNLNSFISVKNPNELNKVIVDSNDYDSFIHSYVNEFVMEDDVEKLLLMCSRDYLKNHLTKNNEKIIITYRRKINDSFNWYKVDIIASTFEPSGKVESVIILATNIHDEVKLSLTYKNNMDEYKELFINSQSEIYTDILFINLETLYSVKTMFKNNSLVEEAFNRPWNIVYKDILKIIDDQYKNIIKDNLSIESLLKLEYGNKNTFRYCTKSRNNARWFTSTVQVIEIRGVKHAVVFSMDITRDFNELLNARRNSEYDGLTMLFNRRKLISLIDEEYQYLSSCGVIFFDINGLKETNDLYGHQAGDVIIKIAADSIKSIENDDIHGYRYGGDEFLVIVKNKSNEFVKNLVTRINDYINKQNQNSQYKCKIAIGTAYSDTRIDVDELIEIADGVMYAEKKRMNNIIQSNEKEQKVNNLLKFLVNEYDVIYEANLKEDSVKLLATNDKLVLTEIPVNSSYSGVIHNVYSRYAKNLDEIKKLELNSIISILRDYNNVTFNIVTISDLLFEVKYRCIKYDENDNPEIVITTIKFLN